MARGPIVGLVVAATLAAAACVPIDPGATNGGNASTGNSNAALDPTFGPPEALLSKPGQYELVFEASGPERGAINYLLYLPKGIDAPLRRSPLVLYLHGQSLRGDDPKLLLRYGLPKRLAADAEFPFVVVSPQLRPGQRWTDFDAIVALLDFVIASYPIDPERVYITGFSMGGGGTWRTTNARPDRFAAAAPLAGRGEPGEVRGLAQVPVWAFHGDADEAEPLASSQAMVDAVNAAGGSARLTVLPGRGHDIADLYFGREIFAWMLQHRRLGDGRRVVDATAEIPPISELPVRIGPRRRRDAEPEGPRAEPSGARRNDHGRAAENADGDHE